MSITVFRGLPGSGKSKRLIQVVNRERSAGRRTVTVVSADAAWTAGYESYAQTRLLHSRQPGGPSCPIDHFISTPELADVLDRVEPSTLVAVEEAQMFGVAAARVWKQASDRGVDLVLVSPSAEQIELMNGSDYATVDFSLLCELCNSREAETALLDPETDRVFSVCGSCFHAAAVEGLRRTVQLLIDELPHRGQAALYQPVELPECADWPVSRPDCEARAALVEGIVRESGLLSGRASGHATYLDLGCSTGFFCNRFQGLGMRSMGVDAVHNNVTIAKLLDCFVRREARPDRRFVTYHVADAYDYLRDTTNEFFDVVSAFSVIQWIMSQRSVDEAIECFQWVFDKTKHICVIEMGYSSQDNYGELLPIVVDRKWVADVMKLGAFDEVRIFDAEEAGVMRDLFVGIRTPTTADASSS
jgi:SAM-dependent methyltransferase